MAYLVHWIEHGVLSPEQLTGPEPVDRLHARRFEQGAVRIVSGSRGTEVKWMVGTPCTASLLRAVLHIAKSPAPYVLRFHLIGWFEEVYHTASETVARMEEILARGDRYLPSRAFVREADPAQSDMPPVIRQSLDACHPVEEYAVVCTAEDFGRGFTVNRVGPKSIIGRLWGTVTSTFPCQPHSKFGHTVSEAYERVLSDGKPRYDQVIAALRFPDNQIHWLPYHRAIFPNAGSRDSASVTVVAEVARVKMNVL